MDNYELEAQYAEQVTEEFEPVMMYPVVAYHGSLRSEWGLYYISDSRYNSGLVLEPLRHVSRSSVPMTGSLRQVSWSSVSMTGKFINPATGEIR